MLVEFILYLCNNLCYYICCFLENIWIIGYKIFHPLSVIGEYFLVNFN